VILDEHAVASMRTVVIPDILYCQYMKPGLRRRGERGIRRRRPKRAGMSAQMTNSNVILEFRKAEGSDMYWPTPFFRVKAVDVDKTRVFNRSDNVSTGADE
jgi:hypothetical protein